MKPEELMIGDLFKVNGYITRIKDIVYLEKKGFYVAGCTTLKNRYFPVCYDPIPLTSEILEKNGIKYQYGMPWYQGGYDGLGYEVHFDQHCQISITYVHELQHALKLCSINKEIKV